MAWRIVISSAGCVLLSLRLLGEPAGAIAGRVADESGGPLPGVTVEARGQAGESRVTVTDRTGSFAFSGLPADVYRVTFRLANFAGVVRAGVAVSGTGTEKVDTVMHLTATADVVVTGKKTFTNLADIADAGKNLIGVADAASQGTVSGKQLDARPVLRPGEVLESVPGLVISQHSGEGKANQYYLRGFNLDHGTDFATSVIDYFYRSRLPGEPASGVDDIHTHPAEPRSGRFSVLYSF